MAHNGTPQGRDRSFDEAAHGPEPVQDPTGPDPMQAPVQDPVQDIVEDPAQGADVESPDALRWDITLTNPTNPFTSRLVFSEAGDDLLWWDLDPLTLTNLISALTEVQHAQAAILGVTPPHTRATATADLDDLDGAAPTRAPDSDRARPAGPTSASWWGRHKFLTFLLIVIGISLLYPLIFGGSQI